jgi:uncharacterized membrane protein YbhN (UPF0104 family)
VGEEVARLAMLIQLSMVTVQVTFLLLGGLAWTIPASPNPNQSAASFAIVVGLVTMAALLDWLSWEVHRRRRRAFELLRREKARVVRRQPAPVED